jgi:hypothetical protein
MKKKIKKYFSNKISSTKINIQYDIGFSEFFLKLFVLT